MAIDDIFRKRKFGLVPQCLVTRAQTKPEKQSTFFMEVGEIETMEKNSHNQSIGQETGEVHKGQYKRLRRCLRFEREDLGTIVIRLTSTLLLNDDIPTERWRRY